MRKKKYFQVVDDNQISLRSPFINKTKTNTALSMKERNSEVSVKAGLYNYCIFIAIDSYWQKNSRINTQKDFYLKILCNDNPHGPKIEPRRLAVKNTHRYTNKLLYNKFKIPWKAFAVFLDKRSIAPRKHMWLELLILSKDTIKYSIKKKKMRF